MTEEVIPLNINALTACGLLVQIRRARFTTTALKRLIEGAHDDPQPATRKGASEERRVGGIGSVLKVTKYRDPLWCDATFAELTATDGICS